MPAVLGRICPAPCEKVCRRGEPRRRGLHLRTQAGRGQRRSGLGGALSAALPPGVGQAGGDCRRRASRAGGGLLPGPRRPCLHDLRRGSAARRAFAGGKPREIAPRSPGGRDRADLAIGRASFAPTARIGRDAIADLRRQFDAVLIACQFPSPLAPGEGPGGRAVPAETLKLRRWASPFPRERLPRRFPACLPPARRYTAAAWRSAAWPTARTRPPRSAAFLAGDCPDFRFAKMGLSPSALEGFFHQDRPHGPRGTGPVGRRLRSGAAGRTIVGRCHGRGGDHRGRPLHALRLPRPGDLQASPLCSHLRRRPARYKAPRRRYQQDASHAAVLFEPGKCIACGLCIEIAASAGETLGLSFIGRGFDVAPQRAIGRCNGRGAKKSAAACVAGCPTAALAWKDETG